MEMISSDPGIGFESSIATAPGTLLYSTRLPSCRGERIVHPRRKHVPEESHLPGAVGIGGPEVVIAELTSPDILPTCVEYSAIV